MSLKIRQAFLILSDKSTDKLVDFYNQIKKSTGSLDDCFLMYHQKNDRMPSDIEHVRKFIFSDEIITHSNYFPLGFSLVPGNNHYPLIRFFLEHPYYDYYWCIEDDVCYNGDWNFFF